MKNSLFCWGQFGKQGRVKKVLALVLAFAMAFTMMATAGAAYTDQADIEATEAVEMLTTLGIMSGDGDGSFRPNDTVTRAEMCRMIYTILSGGNDNADNYADMQTTFKDVPADAWYAGYVKHCQASGIVSGTSATTFEPSRNVTGVEAALMCLRMMGYDPAKADIGGSTWSTKTVSIATEAELLKDVNSVVTSALPRQYAAQIMYNMIDAHTVRWSDDANGYTNTNLIGQYYEKVGAKYLDLSTDIGTVVAIDGSDMTISISKEDAPDSYHDGWDADKGYQGSNQTFVKVPQDYSGYLGQRVKVMFEDGKLNSVIGVYAMDDNNAYTVNAKDVESDGNKVKFDGKSYTLDGDGKANTIEVWGVDIEGDVSPAQEDQDSKYFDDADQKAISYTFVDNDGDGKLEYAIATEAIAAKVTYASSTQIVAGGETYKFDDENIDEDLVKDDWAIISYNRYDECKDIVKADVIKDTLTRTKTSSGVDQYEIDGVWYNEADEAVNKTADINTVKAGDTVEAVAVNGILFYVKRTSASSNGEISDVALVLDVDKTISGRQAHLAFFDGSKKVVDIDSDSLVPTVGKVYEYTVSSGEYSFESTLNPEDDYYGDFTAVTTGALASDSVGSVKIADDAKVMLYADNDRKMITGKQFDSSFNSLKNAKLIAGFKGDMGGLTRIGALAVAVDELPDTLDTNDNYAYILDDATTSGRNTISYYIWTGSEMIEVTEDKNSTANREQGTVIGYKSIDSENNNLIEDVAVKTLDVARIDGVNSSNDTLVLEDDFDNGIGKLGKAGTAGEYDVVNDTTVIFVNSDNDFDSKDENGNIGVPGDNSFDDSIYANILYMADSNDEFELVVVDVAGEFTNSPYVQDRVGANDPVLTASVDKVEATYGTEKEQEVTLTAKNIDTSEDAATVTVVASAEGITVEDALKTIAKDATTATGKITVANTVAAGTYTVTFTCGDAKAVVDVVVAKAEIANANDLTLTIETPVQGRVKAPTTLTAGTGYTAAYAWTVADKAASVGDAMFTDDEVVLTVTLTADANHTFASTASSNVDLTANSPDSTDLDAVSSDGSTLTLTYTWNSIS